ncbi:GNAT family N-acetyltransferase [Gallaecimonas sp. GXIMD4217]|uniref:GNAT family N-acetyltransferase n=1 Tax=Gallaecimonas sp. GXIMD4217 TaxID=3131927 RepID=UPI00311B1BC7
MTIPDCHFHTPRLQVRPWRLRLAGLPDRDAFAGEILKLLTPAVTRTLPPGWQQIQTREQAELWLRERDAESAMLVVEHQGALVGLLFLHGDDGDLHLGYLLGEMHWGQGLASELISGLVAWAGQQGGIHTLVGGVETDNGASIRVLEKAGFTRREDKAAPQGVIFLEHRLQGN